MDPANTSGDGLVVLVVDPERAISDRFVSHVDRQERFRVRTETDVPTARGRLRTESIDCLVVVTTPGDDEVAFLTDANRIAPDCPVVVVTDEDTSEIAGDVYRRATTIVERGDDPDNLGFLAEKIDTAVRTSDGTPATEEMYRSLVETARDGLYRLDANGNVIYANESFADMLGYDREEILGAHASGSMVDGELERGQRVIQQVLAADDRESDIIDVEMETKGGDRITVAVHFSVLTTDDGVYDGVVGVARDVTDRREQERELERKNERLEEFASVVSHDLRSPLTVAEGRLALARQDVENEHLDEAAKALDRMNDLIDDLLALAQKGETDGRMEPVDLEEVAAGCWRNVATAETTLRSESSLTLRADRGRLKQLLENLFRNAVEHGSTGHADGGGSEAVREHDDVTVTVGDVDGGFYVADDGPGIPQDARDSIFDAGYSTSTEGTGFGLSIVKEVVADHGWQIDVTESDAGGARFEVTGVETVDD